MKELKELISILSNLDKPKITSKKQRGENNQEAINLVKKLNEENRKPTSEEKNILLKFTGYGGIGGDKDEYYTPREVAEATWELMGVEEGDTILDPSTGAGIFSSTAPKGVKIKGCDYSPISGQIANLTNDNSEIKSGISFEEYSESIADNSMDGIISNVPFGNRDNLNKGIDKEHKDISKNEVYFIIKSLKILKPSKRAIFLTTSSVAQRKTYKTEREAFSKYASFVGGFRLPSEMFMAGGTDQVVDILVFEKHPAEILRVIEQGSMHWGTWAEVVDKDKANSSFIQGLYFNKHPRHIIGNFKSKEESIKEAEAKGEKIHHQAQKDTVTLPRGKTLLDIKLNMKQYLQKINNTFKYEDLAFSISEPITDSLVVNIKTNKAILENTLQNELELLHGGFVGNLLKNDAFIKLYDEATEVLSISKKDMLLLLARYRSAKQPQWSDFLNRLFFSTSDIDPQVIKDNIATIKSIIKNKTKLVKPHTPYQGLIVLKLNELSKYSLETGLYIEDITEKIGEEESIFSNKKGTLNNKDGLFYFNPEEFSKEDLTSSSELIIREKGVAKLEDWLNINEGANVEEIVESVRASDIETSSLNEKEIEKHKQEIIDSIYRDFSPKVEVEDFVVTLSMVEVIFDRERTSELLYFLSDIKTIGLKARDLAIEALAKHKMVKDKNNAETIYREMVISSPYYQLVSHLIREDVTYRMFVKDIMLGQEAFPQTENESLLDYYVREERFIGTAKSIIRESYYKVVPLMQEALNQEIRNDIAHKKILEEWLKKTRTLTFTKEYNENKCTELSGMINEEWLNKARHYQNADSRKFAEEMQGINAYDTGLGKSFWAFMTALQMLQRKKAKRVAYVIPNAIFGKMVKEAQNALTADMLKQTLFIDTKASKTELDRLRSDKTIRFIVCASSTLTSQCLLQESTVRKIFGRSLKEEKTGADLVDYGPNNLGHWVSKTPSFKSSATHYFEDLGIDAMLLDEGHFYKNAISSVKAVKGLTSSTSNDAVIMVYFAEYIKGIKRGDMRGVIISTATPTTSSPTEIETALVLATDRKGLKSSGVHSKLDFEKRHFFISKKSVLKTDGVSMAERDVLEKIENINMIHNAGYNKVLFRTAEAEEAKAQAKGDTISVKPHSEEYRAVLTIDKKGKELYEGITSANKHFSQVIRYERENTTPIEDIEEYKNKLMIAKEYGEIFGYISRVGKIAVSKAFAKGYIQIELKTNDKDAVMRSIGGNIVEVKEATVEVDEAGAERIKIKKIKVPLSEYELSEYHAAKQKYTPGLTHDLVEGKTLYFPSLNYAEIKKVLAQLKKDNLRSDISFKIGGFQKLGAVIENIKKELERKPKAKQIVYATTLATHHVLEELLKIHVKEIKKVWHYNGEALKNADKKLQVQVEFNDFSEPGIMIFGKAGQVGVDFNKNVSAVHLVDIGETPDARHQAKGRAVRQGNEMDKVNVYNYMASGTFDIFLEELVNNKSNWITAINNNENSTNFTDDTIETLSSQAELAFGHLNISTEEMIKMYIEEKKKEHSEFQKTIETINIEIAISDAEKFSRIYSRFDKERLLIRLFGHDRRVEVEDYLAANITLMRKLLSDDNPALLRKALQEESGKTLFKSIESQIKFILKEKGREHSTIKTLAKMGKEMGVSLEGFSAELYKRCKEKAKRIASEDEAKYRNYKEILNTKKENILSYISLPENVTKEEAREHLFGNLIPTKNGYIYENREPMEFFYYKKSELSLNYKSDGGRINLNGEEFYSPEKHKISTWRKGKIDKAKRGVVFSLDDIIKKYPEQKDGIIALYNAIEETGG